MFHLNSTQLYHLPPYQPCTTTSCLLYFSFRHVFWWMARRAMAPFAYLDFFNNQQQKKATLHKFTILEICITTKWTLIVSWNWHFWTSTMIFLFFLMCVWNCIYFFFFLKKKTFFFNLITTWTILGVFHVNKNKYIMWAEIVNWYNDDVKSWFRKLHWDLGRYISWESPTLCDCFPYFTYHLYHIM